MDLTVIRVYLAVWGGATLVVRMVYARRAGRRKAQSGASRIHPHPLVVGSMALWVGFLVVFTTVPQAITNPGLMVYFPAPMAVQIPGLVGLAAGLWLLLRAHRALGEFYGVSLFVKESHRVIDTGPYAYIRHPMYTAYALWLVSTPMFIPHYGMLALLPPAFVGFYRMAKQEERMLLAALGKPYEAYLGRTGMFLPKW